MSKIKIAIGADHRGFDHKSFIIQNITSTKSTESTQITESTQSIAWLDAGCYSSDRCDYPLYAKSVVDAIYEKEASLGVLLCGSGIGMSIVANRFAGMYAGLCWSEELAVTARQHDNINILVLPSDFVSPQESVCMIYAWLGAEFKAGRYQDRLDMIEQLT